jgi:hypothetical protein
MHGLFRVRGFTQDDAHIFCLPSQIASEIRGVLDLVEEIMSTYGFRWARPGPGLPRGGGATAALAPWWCCLSAVLVVLVVLVLCWCWCWYWWWWWWCRRRLHWRLA